MRGHLEARAAPVQRSAISAAAASPSARMTAPFFLVRFGDNIGLALGLLLGDLLLLDGAAELLAEDEVRDRDVIQNDVEVVGALRERRADLGPVRLCVSV